MRLVILGAPGSGKGTQAARLREHLQVPHVSTGELLRAAVTAGTALGLQAKSVMESGGLVSDDIVLGMLEERLLQSDAANGFILDGYPRNLPRPALRRPLADRATGHIAVQLDAAGTLADRLSSRAHGRSCRRYSESVRKRPTVCRTDRAGGG
jgi:adenylate kinase